MSKHEYAKKTLAAALAAVMLAGCGVNASPKDDTVKDKEPIVSDNSKDNNSDAPTQQEDITKEDNPAANDNSDDNNTPIAPTVQNSDTALKPISVEIGPSFAGGIEEECYEALNRFSFDLYNKIAKESGEKSSVMSSLSAHYALGMLLQGAKGETAAEISEALGISTNEAAVMAYIINNQYRELSKNTDTALNIANGIFMADRLDTSSCEPTYTALENYSAEAFSGELSDDYAREFINNWVSERTDGMIPEVLDNNLDESAILVLINTILLDAKWQSPFIYYGEAPKMDFTSPSGETAQLEALAGEKFIEHIDAPDAKGLILDYSDGRLKFAAIMPKNADDSEFIGGMSYEKFAEYIGSAKSELCYMEMPKFTIESSIDLNDTAKAMGMELIFDEKDADLSGFGVSPNGNIFVSRIFQKAKIEVAEEGTKAAAATVVEASDGCALMDPPPQIILDHSFFYCVYDSETMTPLFMGRFSGE